MNDHHTKMPATVPMISAYTISSQISIDADKPATTAMVKRAGRPIATVDCISSNSFMASV